MREQIDFFGVLPLQVVFACRLPWDCPADAAAGLNCCGGDTIYSNEFNLKSKGREQSLDDGGCNFHVASAVSSSSGVAHYKKVRSHESR